MKIIFLCLVFMTNISLGQCYKDKFTTQLSSKDSLLADSVYYKLINHAIKFSTEPDTCGGAFDEDIIVYHQSKIYGSDATANSYLIRYNNKTPNIFFLQEKYWSERHTITIPCVYNVSCVVNCTAPFRVGCSESLIFFVQS